MNLLTNLYNSILSLYKYFLDKYTYKIIIVYILKSRHHVHEQIIFFDFNSFNNRA